MFNASFFLGFFIKYGIFDLFQVVYNIFYTHPLNFVLRCCTFFSFSLLSQAVSSLLFIPQSCGLYPLLLSLIILPQFWMPFVRRFFWLRVVLEPYIFLRMHIDQFQTGLARIRLIVTLDQYGITIKMCNNFCVYCSMCVFFSKVVNCNVLFG